MLSLLILTRTNWGSPLRAVAFSTAGPASLTRKILQEKKYRDLKHSLEAEKEQPRPLLRMARFVLSENIRVARLALEVDDVLYFPHNWQPMDKRQIVKAANRRGYEIPPEIKINRFTAKEDSVILSNWKHLQVRAGLKQSEAEVMLERSSSDSETEFRCKILASLYLSQGLPNIRFPCEVFHRAKQLSIKTGEFTSEEDQTIEDFVSTHGRKWSQLGKILNRNAHSVLARYNEQIKFKDSSQRGQFSLEEDLEILEFMFLNSEDVLKKDVKYYQLSHQVGTQLSRKPLAVHGHWLGVIQPLLTRHLCPGDCLEVDYASILISHMVNNGWQYGQHVPWSDLVTLSEFEGETTFYHFIILLLFPLLGTTPRYLQKLYDKAVSCTKKKYGLVKEEVTSDIVLAWLEERKPRKKRKNMIEREEKIIEFYQILRKERENSLSC